MRLVHEYFRRPPAERRLILRAAALVSLVRIGLWVLPYKRVRRMVEQRSQPRSGAPAAPRYAADDIVRVVGAVSRRIPDASCLTQALSAQRLLAHEGYESLLQIGVARNESGTFEAHAWLEREGRIIIGEIPGLARYTPLPTRRDEA
jgi:hypothetical protein